MARQNDWDKTSNVRKKDVILTYDLWLEGWLHFPSLDLLPTDQFEKYVALDALFSFGVFTISWNTKKKIP